MKNFFYFITLLLLLSCKSQKEHTTILYENEVGRIEKFNFKNKNKPLMVLIPSVYGSLLNEKYIEELAKNYRVALVYFLSYNDVTRQQQLDGLTNRLTYYSTALNSFIEDGDSISFLVAEGLNANIAVHLGHSFSYPKLALINAWYPSLQQIITSHCLSQQSITCDSLANYLALGDKAGVVNMMRSLQENGPDRQLGNFTTNIWQDFLNYNTADLVDTYKSEVAFIYTSNSGLLNFTEVEQLRKGYSKQKNTKLLSVNDFYKNPLKFNK